MGVYLGPVSVRFGVADDVTVEGGWLSDADGDVTHLHAEFGRIISNFVSILCKGKDTNQN